MSEFYGLEPGGLLPATALAQLDTARMEVVAAGRPDIPATTPYTSAQLNAMPVGARYRSTDGPQGAWEWRKTGATAWSCVDGDTGRRSLSTSLLNGWTGAPRVHRTMDWVTLQFATTPARLNGGAATDHPFLQLPPGFTLPSHNYSFVGTLGGVITTTNQASIYQQTANQLATVSRLTDLTGLLSWRTSDPWPTTLPGTSA